MPTPVLVHLGATVVPGRVLVNDGSAPGPGVLTKTSGAGPGVLVNQTGTDPGEYVQYDTPDTPTGLAAVGGTGNISVTWNPSVGATGYDLRWSNDNVTWTNILGVTSAYSDTAAKTNIATTGLLYYQVRANSAAGSSPWSASSTPVGVDLSTLTRKVHLRADSGTFQDAALTTPTTADGQLVAGWADQSGNTNKVTQTTIANRPVIKLAIKNGLSVVRSDGTNDNMTSAVFAAALAQPNTVFLAAQLNGGTGTNRILLDGGTGREVLGFIDTPASTNKWGYFAGTVVDSAIAGDANWNIWSGLFNGASSTLRKNGTQIAAGNPGAQTLTRLWLMSDQGNGDAWCNADLAEVIVCNAGLTVPQQQAVETYLNVRWGVF